MCCVRLSPADRPSRMLGYFDRNLAPQEEGRTTDLEQKLAGMLSKMGQVWRPNKDMSQQRQGRVRKGAREKGDINTLESGDFHFKASRLQGPMLHHFIRRVRGSLSVISTNYRVWYIVHLSQNVVTGSAHRLD